MGKAYVDHLLHEQVPSSLTTEYVPKVGDVIEFEYEGKTCDGVILNLGVSNPVAVLSKFNCPTYGWNPRIFLDMLNVRKTGVCDSIPDTAIELSEARDIFRAYQAQPTFTGTYAERQAQWVKHYGVKVGTKVKVVREAIKKEDGWDGIWPNPMNRLVGDTLDVLYIGLREGQGIELNCVGVDWWFPYFVLEVQ